MTDGVPPKEVLRWRSLAQRAEAQTGVPAATLLALVEHESGGEEGLTSSVGARGLTQFMPGTAATYNVNVEPGHAWSQILGAAKYLKDLGYDDDPELALNSYAAGPGNPEAAGGYGAAVLESARRYGGTASAAVGLDDDDGTATPNVGGGTAAASKALQLLLTLALIIAGTGLAVAGLSRLVGVRNPVALAKRVPEGEAA